eukprot:8646026-Pyramimonas_sp.AAC.1
MDPSLKQAVEKMKTKSPAQYRDMIKVLMTSRGSGSRSEGRRGAAFQARAALSDVVGLIREFTKEIVRSRKKGYLLLTKGQYIAYQVGSGT